jgi:serine/threonine-protein kinase HipA
MSKEKKAAVWTRIGTQPVRMGALEAQATNTKFTYDEEFLEIGLPGLGIVLAPSIYKKSSIIRAFTQSHSFPPPIQSLVPPHSNGKNFQRELTMRLLEKKGIKPTTSFEADWEILKIAGHGGIGHIDVFASDEEAVEWYSTPSSRKWHDIEPEIAPSLKNFLTWFDDSADSLIDIIGPTPTVGGAIPKLLISIPQTGWDGRIAMPTRFGDRQKTDVILKMEKPEVYPGLVELEALALDVHKEAGFEVPRYWTTEIYGLNAIAIERFDRDKQRTPVFLETMYSILASGNKDITNNYDAEYELISRAIDNNAIEIVSNRTDAKEHLFRRVVMALLTGNGDLHMENLTIIQKNGNLSFSPVYDPTPMRAYKRHNIKTPMAFGGYGETTSAIGVAVKAFGKSLGIPKTIIAEVVDHYIELTDNYSERVNELTTLPVENKENLINIHKEIRSELEG